MALQHSFERPIQEGLRSFDPPVREITPPEGGTLARNHVVISGTGRCGTTFLVELLTALGQDTGYREEDLAGDKDASARAGLERDVRDERCPYIVKNPWFCDYAEGVLRREDIQIDHVLVPMRNLEAAAESRRHVVRTAVRKLPLADRVKHLLKPKRFPGGLWHTSSNEPGSQEEVLLRQVYALMLAVSDTGVPVTFLRYPRLVEDADYLFDKLAPILRDVNRERFEEAFARTVRPELVHRFNASDR